MCSAEAAVRNRHKVKSVENGHIQNVRARRGRGKCAKARLRQAQMARAVCEAGMVRGQNAAKTDVG